MIKIAFLLDANNDWLLEYFPKDLTSSKKFDIHICYKEKEVRGFDLVFVLGYTKLLKGKILDANELLLVILSYLQEY